MLDSVYYGPLSEAVVIAELRRTDFTEGYNEHQLKFIGHCFHLFVFVLMHHPKHGA